MQRALALYGDLGNRRVQADALYNLGMVQQETGDYTAAAASHQQALELFRGFGHRRCEAAALNNLGQLATQTADTCSSRHQHA